MRKIVGTMKLNRTLGLFVLLLLSVMLAACGGGEKAGSSGGETTSQRSGTTPAASSASSGSKTAESSGLIVKMSNYSFNPKEIRAKVGQTITFVNEDHLAHDVVQTVPEDVLFGDEPSFESPQIMPDSKWTITFDKPGTYPILCTVESHYLLGMTGEIIVEE